MGKPLTPGPWIPGDWVQAAEGITEPGFNGHNLWTHAKVNAVGHVMAVDQDDDGEWWATVTWERTGTTTDCHSSEIRFLCHADAGKQHAVP